MHTSTVDINTLHLVLTSNSLFRKISPPNKPKARQASSTEWMVRVFAVVVVASGKCWLRLAAGCFVHLARTTLLAMGKWQRIPILFLFGFDSNTAHTFTFGFSVFALQNRLVVLPATSFRVIHENFQTGSSASGLTSTGEETSGRTVVALFLSFLRLLFLFYLYWQIFTEWHLLSRRELKIYLLHLNKLS